MPNKTLLLDSLRQRQNEDGGWGYNRGESWTEPTALALLAMSAAGLNDSTYDRGIAWLRSHQLADGGWPSNATVVNSSSVTSAAVLVLGTSGQTSESYSAGLHWTVRQARPDLTLTERFRFWLAGMPAADYVSGGCPWVPGAASWVAPTVMMTLVFRQAICLGFKDPSLPILMERAERYVLARRCPDGGWSHGGSEFRNPNPESYPEMTGLALLAFEPAQSSQMVKSLDLASRMAENPTSSEAQSFLGMALLRHGRTVPNAPPRPCRNTRDLALRILADSGERNPLFV